MPYFAALSRNRTAEAAKNSRSGQAISGLLPLRAKQFLRHRPGDQEAVGKLINPGRPANIQLMQQLFRGHRLELTSGCRNRPRNARIPFGLR